MERVDDTGFGGIRVIQTRGLGYGVDAVLLAAFAAGETGAKGLQKNAAKQLRIADLGTGSGVIAFVIHRKLGGKNQHQLSLGRNGGRPDNRRRGGPSQAV